MAMAEMGQIKRSHDWANLVFGFCLFGAPWLYRYAGSTPVAYTGWISGALVMVAAFAALMRFSIWEEWIALLLGVWIFLAPFVIGFTNSDFALQVHIIVGLAIVIASGMKIWNVLHPQMQSVS